MQLARPGIPDLDRARAIGPLGACHQPAAVVGKRQHCRHGNPGVAQAAPRLAPERVPELDLAFLICQREHLPVPGKQSRGKPPGPGLQGPVAGRVADLDALLLVLPDQELSPRREGKERSQVVSRLPDPVALQALALPNVPDLVPAAGIAVGEDNTAGVQQPAIRGKRQRRDYPLLPLQPAGRPILVEIPQEDG
jgi:hypothetical protein